MAKAIQWSNASTRLEKRLMATHPMKGMAAWKKPNKKAIFPITRQRILRMVTPLTTDTAKQSIANATANKNISNKPILFT